MHAHTHERIHTLTYSQKHALLHAYSVSSPIRSNKERNLRGGRRENKVIFHVLQIFDKIRLQDNYYILRVLSTCTEIARFESFTLWWKWILTVMCCLQVLDLDIRAIRCLEYLNCDRNGMRSLQVNGTSLKNLFASHNSEWQFNECTSIVRNGCWKNPPSWYRLLAHKTRDYVAVWPFGKASLVKILMDTESLSSTTIEPKSSLFRLCQLHFFVVCAYNPRERNWWIIIQFGDESDLWLMSWSFCFVHESLRRSSSNLRFVTVLVYHGCWYFSKPQKLFHQSEGLYQCLLPVFQI